jgi:hypothetical protein
VVEREIPPVVGLVAEALDDERRARARASKAPSPASPHQGSAPVDPALVERLKDEWASGMVEPTTTPPGGPSTPAVELEEYGYGSNVLQPKGGPST